MRLYIASTLANWRCVRSYQRIAEEAGFRITYDWTPLGEQRSAGEVIYDPQLLCRFAEQEMNGVLSADGFLLVLPAGAGSHVELGLFLGAGNGPAIVLGDCDLPTSFYYLPWVRRVRDLSAALGYLKQA